MNPSKVNTDKTGMSSHDQKMDNDDDENDSNTNSSSSIGKLNTRGLRLGSLISSDGRKDDDNSEEVGDDDDDEKSKEETPKASPLFVAIEAKDIEKMKEILKEDSFDPNESLKPNEQRPLYMAAYTSFTDGIEVLLAFGADPNLSNKSGNGHTPLYACASNGHFGTGDHATSDKPSLDTYDAYTAGIRLLLDHGADPNGCTRDGATPLYGAAIHGDAVSLKVLLERGADPNFVMVRMDGRTALHGAADRGSRECLRMLLKNNADPNHVTRSQQVTPLFVAAQKGHSVCVKYLIYQGGADWNKPDRNGRTPLYIASLHVDEDFVKDLVLWNYSRRTGRLTTNMNQSDRHRNVTTSSNIRDSDDDGFDQYASKHSSSGVREAKSNVSLSLRGLRHNHEECVRLLLERGDPNPLRKAIELSNEELVDMILRRQHMEDLEDDDDIKRQQKLRIKFLKDRTFVLFKPCGQQFMVFLLKRDDFPWKAKQIILDRAMKEVEDESELLSYLHASLEDLSAKSIEHDTIFLLMMDFYFYIVWIWTFGVAISNHLQDVDDTFVVGMVVVSIYFLIRESFELGQNGYGYFRDYWNLINCVSIALVLVTVAKLLDGKSLLQDSPDFDPTFQKIVMSAGAFVNLSFVGYLKVTFVAFSEFVGGVTQIMEDLLPFATISLIVLLGFSFMYYIQHFGEEGFETYGTTFYTIFTFFVSGLEETTGPLDLIFGILSVIILLNVVIAIVSASWENAVESSLILLCKYRLELLRQVGAFSKPIECLLKFLHDIFPIDFDDWDENYKWFIDNRIIPPPEHKGEEWWHLELSDKERKEWNLKMKLWTLYSFPIKFLVYVLLWIIGLVSFGLYWPKSIRNFLFGISAKGTQVSSESQKIEEGEIADSQQQLLQIRKDTESIGGELVKLRKDVRSIIQPPITQRQPSDGLDPPSSLISRMGRVEEKMNQVNADIASIKETNKEILRLLTMQRKTA